MADFREREPVCKVLKTLCIFHVQTSKKTVPLALHLNFRHFEASGEG